MKKFDVGIIGATGMVGQRFITLLENHPWFNIKVLAASEKSAGKKYGELMSGRWHMSKPIPENVSEMIVRDAVFDMENIASEVDFVFCAVNMPKEDIIILEEAYAKFECPVISNNSAHRNTDDVPMIIPEVNPQHSGIIHTQRKRLGTQKGFIAVKSNCSIQSYVPALHALSEYGLGNVVVTTYQAISGAGKTFETWPEMVDNVIPYIGGEEEKSEKEPLKIWGSIKKDKIVPATSPSITTQCLRVPVSDGHMAAVFANLKTKVSVEEIIATWSTYEGVAQQFELPSAPKKFLHYFYEEDRPQTRLDRDLENGMAVSIGRLREDSQFSIKFVSLSHNTVRGAAGGAVLMAELLVKQGYID